MGEGLIFLDELDCSGSEIKLLACPSNDPGQHNCFHSEDVGVICLTSNSCECLKYCIDTVHPNIKLEGYV